MDQGLKDLGDHVAASLPGAVTGTSIELHELMLQVDAAQVVKVMTFLRDDGNCQFRVLIDICGVDYPERGQRFDVVYNLLSLTHNHRIRVKVQTDEDTPVPSVNSVFAAAGWFEREAWDMYGIMFTGHPDLRRLLTDYGFDGYPLRKDFPLSGFVEVRYDDAEKRVVYEPVKLTQEFRKFDFLSPWEGAEYALPGDEKAAAPPAPPKAN